MVTIIKTKLTKDELSLIFFSVGIIFGIYGLFNLNQYFELIISSIILFISITLGWYFYEE